ncbi:hypothetical protein D3C71_1435980 [compost metagenome]
MGLASTVFTNSTNRLLTPITSKVCAVARAMKGSALVGSIWLTTSRTVKYPIPSTCHTRDRKCSRDPMKVAALAARRLRRSRTDWRFCQMTRTAYT